MSDKKCAHGSNINLECQGGSLIHVVKWVNRRDVGTLKYVLMGVIHARYTLHIFCFLLFATHLASMGPYSSSNAPLGETCFGHRQS